MHHDIRPLTGEAMDVGNFRNPQPAVIAAGKAVAGRPGDAQRALGLGLVFGKVLSGTQPDVQKRTGVVRGRRHGPGDAGQPQKLRQRQRRLVERRQDHGLCNARVPDEVHELLEVLTCHRGRRVGDPRAVPNENLCDAGEQRRGGFALRAADEDDLIG
jgi:hypothetical protein